MKKTLQQLLTITVTLGMLTLSSCKKDKNNEIEEQGPPSGSSQKNTVTGIVKDGQGRPIAGAKVRIENDFHYYDVTTNNQGQYSCYVATFGSYKAVAWASIPYQGKTYSLRMGMPNTADYDFFDPRNGAVRNFQLQISGLIPDRSATNSGTNYFGFALELNNTGDIYNGLFLKPGETVAIVLEPEGPLMGGSTGERIEKTVTVPAMNESMFVTDIPIGKYTLYAYVARNGEWQLIKAGPFSTQLNTSMAVLPTPILDNTGSYEGPGRVRVYLGQ